MPTRHSSEALSERLVRHQCELISEYAGARAPAAFVCLLCKETFHRSVNTVLKRREGEPGCGKCFARLNRDRAIATLTEEIRQYVESRGGTLITERVVLVKSRITIRCSKGHEWRPVAEAMKNLRTWCPYCAKNAKRSLDDLAAIVKSRGGKLITDEYKGVDATYSFECILGHRFTNMFKKVESGQWCPTCNKGRISEEVARTTFEQLFGVPFPKERPQWLRNSRGRLMEIDGANLDLGIGFEYHGAQHFQKTLYIKDDAKLAKRQEDDATKERLCREHGIALVVLTHEMTYPEFPEQIRRQLLEDGVDLSRVDFAMPIDLSRAYVRTDRLEELRELMETKQIDVLSTAWLGSNHAYEMRCRVCGHKWSAPGNSFFNSRRVAGCDRCSRRLFGENLKLGLEPLTEYARSHGGELLSDTYVRRNHYYRWRCSVGHEFDGNFNNMKHRHQFCPVCEGRMKRNRKV